MFASQCVGSDIRLGASYIVSPEIAHILFVFPGGARNHRTSARLGPLDCERADSRAASIDEDSLSRLKPADVEERLPSCLSCERHSCGLRRCDIHGSLHDRRSGSQHIFGQRSLLCLDGYGCDKLSADSLRRTQVAKGLRYLRASICATTASPSVNSLPLASTTIPDSSYSAIVDRTVANGVMAMSLYPLCADDLFR